MVEDLYNFIINCWSWIPLKVMGMFGVFIFLTFADSVFGLIDRGWRVLGR